MLWLVWAGCESDESARPHRLDVAVDAGDVDIAPDDMDVEPPMVSAEECADRCETSAGRCGQVTSPIVERCAWVCGDGRTPDQVACIDEMDCFDMLMLLGGSSECGIDP